MEETSSLASDLESAMSSADSAPSADVSSEPTAESAVSTAPAAIEPAATLAETTPQSTTVVKGEPPQDKWPAILNNARAKARADAESEFAQQYGWAKQVNPEQFQEMVGWYQRANADPVAFAQELIQSLQAHPQHGAALRSLAARALSQGRGQAAQAAEPQMVSVQLEDGSVVAMPRNPAEWLAYNRKQWDAEIEQKFAPLTQTVQTIQQREAETAARAQANQFAGSLVDGLSKLPGFETHKAEIAKWIKNAKLESDHPAEVRAAALEAYASIVAPKLQTSGGQSVLQDINRKALASTVNPAHTSTSAPKSKDEQSLAEALADEYARAAAAG